MQQLLLLQPYQDPKFEDYFKLLEVELISMAKIQGQQDGILDKPDNRRAYTVSMIAPINTRIQKALDFNYALIQPKSDVAIGQSLRKSASDKIFLKGKEKNVKEKSLIIAEGEGRELKNGINLSLSSKLRILTPASFGLCEIILTLNLLQSASFPVIAKYFLSIVIGLCTAFGLHLSANYIRRAKTKLVQKKRFFIVTGLALGVSISLGLWRSALHNQSVSINDQIDLLPTTNSVEHFSSFPFIIISFVAFLVGLLFELKYWMTTEEKKRLKLFEEKTLEIKKIEKEIGTLTHEIELIELDTTTDSAMIIRKQEYAKANEQRLMSLALHTINTYESINIDFRKDLNCPEYFGHQQFNDLRFYFSDIFCNAKQ